jgi:hypothetical protein
MHINLKKEGFSSWLNATRNENKALQYRHLKLQEESNLRNDILNDLQTIIDEAHEDYKRYKRSILLHSLDPTAATIDWEDLGIGDPAYGYPQDLDLTTLKGAFGEIFAGIIAENFSPFDFDNWIVPAFSFRHHETAFDQLETFKRTGHKKKSIIGRHGDDCLAFILDDNTNQITKTLFCEAKCSNSHDSDLIKDAHSKLSDPNLLPVELMRILEILKDYETDSSKKWSKAIANLYVNHNKNSNYERFDLVSYVCGKLPTRKDSWIDCNKPHANYKGNRDLESVEVHLFDVDELIKTLYRKED